MKALVAGTELRLLIDTGADVTMLTRDGASRARIRADGSGALMLMRGVGGMEWAYLTRMTVKVGDSEEPDVLVAVTPGARLGRIDGLLGTSFLERFRFSRDGDAIELVGIDQGEEKRGGRGRSWWSLRFRQNRSRLLKYERLLPAAKKADREMSEWWGVSEDEPTSSEILTRLRDFMLLEKTELEHEAARHAVPLEWRR